MILGANQGIGYETVKNLLLSDGEHPYHVLLGCRDLAKGEEAISALKKNKLIGTVEALKIDVTDDASVDATAKQVADTFGRIDCLVHNAGISRLNHPSPRGAMREIANVNCIGVVSVTEAFLPLLQNSDAPRLVFVSSSTGSMTWASDPSNKLHRSAAKEYRASKAALNMLMVLYSVQLGEGFKVFGADPGLNATNFTSDAKSLRARGAVEPHVGGERIATVVKGNRDHDVGKVCGEYGVCPW